MAGQSRVKRELDVAVNALSTERSPSSGESVEIPHWTTHDLRRTATTGMARLGVPPHVADSILNHKSGTVSGVAAVYNRYSYLEERREALEKWESHVSSLIEAEQFN